MSGGRSTAATGWLPPLRDVASFFDASAGHADGNRMYRWLADRTAHHCELRSGDVVLDIASGSGLATRSLLNRWPGVARHLCLDLSHQQLRHGRRTMPTVAALRGDATRLPLIDGCVDVIVCVSALAYFADLPALLDEFHRVLRPDGRIVVQTWARNAPGVMRVLRTAAAEYGVKVDNPHAVTGDRAAFGRLLTLAGFGSIEWTTESWSADLPTDPARAWTELVGGIGGRQLTALGKDVRERIGGAFRHELSALRTDGPAVVQQMRIVRAIRR